MANEITWSSVEGIYGYDYNLMREALVSALYPANNLLQFLNQRSLAGVQSDSERFPKEPVLAAAAVSDGVDLTNTAYTPSQVTLTVGEVAIMLTLTDLSRTSSFADIDMYGASAGKAVLKKLTGDIAALGSGFSASVGTTTAALTEAQFLSARTLLLIADVPEPYYSVLYPVQLEDLIADTGTTIDALKTTGESVRSQANDLAIPQQGNFGQFHGVTLVTNSQVPTANAGADSAGHMASAGRALAYVEKWGVRMEMERDISLRGSEVVVSTAYAVGEVDDASGVAIVTDR